jgi:hypothetical protein
LTTIPFKQDRIVGASQANMYEAGGMFQNCEEADAHHTIYITML